VLTEPPRQRRRARPQRSLRQEYGEFILERIEEFKNQLSREELLALADEAVQELEVGPEGQLVLTEVMVLEHVDRLITRRLNLPTFRRWRERHVQLRRAQRQPTHWGIEPDWPLVQLSAAYPESAIALTVGAGAAPAGFYLAAHDWPVVFIDRHLSSVESAETQAAGEGLALRFHALVVSLGDWFPDVFPTLTVLDPVTLRGLSRAACRRFLDILKEHTDRGGAHFVLPPGTPEPTAGNPLDMIRSHYEDWRIEQPSDPLAARWLLATPP
jgi:hypothetical protein